MFGMVVSMLIRIAATNAEIECRTDPIDYDISECDGMVEHLMSRPHIQWIGSSIPMWQELEACDWR